MSTLATHVHDYLRMRRALGFKLDREQRLLSQFAAYLQEAGASTVTSNLAIAWARLPVHAQPNQWAQRLAVARRFAAYLQTASIRRPRCPARACSPPADTARRPILWSQRDIRALIESARALRPTLRAATYDTLFGLLATCGMRIGEALTRRRDDVDLHAGVITIREAKLDRERLVPLHPSATEALRGYAAERDRLCPRPRANAFFLSTAGTALNPSGVAVLSTYLGHVSPAHRYLPGSVGVAGADAAGR